MRFAIVDMKSKLCVGVFTSLDSYENGAVFENNTYIQLDGYVEDDKFFLNSYYKNNEFKQLAVRPSQYHIWNLETEQWQEPESYLETIRADGKQQINQLAGQKITAVYPITKQNFLQGRYMELMMLGQTDSDEAKAIAAGWRFIKAVKDASDEANVKINQSETLEAITAIVDEFKLFNT